jgi:hypothetical protein
VGERETVFVKGDTDGDLTAVIAVQGVWLDRS